MWLIVATLGAILGSFLNALLFRYNTGFSVLRGRSRCMHCGHTLVAIDLVPVLSYVALGGRCRYCRSRISPQYPLVEAAAALLSIGLYLHNPDPLVFSVSLLFWLTLLFVVVYDLRHKIIPWSALGLLFVLACVSFYLRGDFGVLAILAGPLLALPLALISLVSGGRAMGWGDSLLEISLGLYLGATVGLTAFVLGFWIGATVGIVLLVAVKRYTMKSEVPFAPFLIAGAAVAYFCNVDLFSTLPALLLLY